jgi:hypothetical protein
MVIGFNGFPAVFYMKPEDSRLARYARCTEVFKVCKVHKVCKVIQPSVIPDCKTAGLHD